jgi:outer membrane protein OmpA-like peptidoglycan-associated protein
MSDATPENTPTSTIYKTLTWILVAALIGLYALYNWYDGRLKRGLAGKDAEIAAAVQRLSSAETDLRAATDAEAGLKAQITRLETEAQAAAASAAGALDAVRQELAELQRQQGASAQELAARQSEIDRLTQDLAQVVTREQGLRAEIEALGEAHAAKLGGLQAELEAAAQATAAHKADLDAAGQRAAALTDEIAGLKESLAEADARHAAEAQSLKAELEERIKHYRTALEGSEPDRAAQIAQLEAQAQAGYAALERAELALKDREAELGGRLEEAIRAAQAQTQALESSEQSHATEISEARGKIFALDEELTSARAEVAGLQEKLDLTVTDLNAKLEQSETALAAAKTELEAATSAAAGERQALEARIQEAQARISALEESLVTERAQAEKALAEQRRQAEAARATERQAGEQALAATRGLYSRFAELAARQTDRGMLLKLAEEDLRFQSGLAVLPRGDLPSLDRIAELLKDHPKLTALIEGHTDSAGPDDINLELSRARADAVRQALIDRGVPEERLTAEGAGEGRPIAENTTAAGRGQNRRVEVYVLEQSE